jgi:hypothetical protein
MTYLSYTDITNELQDRAMTAMRAAGFEVSLGCSNVSCSRYIEVRIGEDEDGDVEAFKIRFSDHDDRHGSDLTIRFERHVEEIEDDFGDIELEIAEWRMDDMVEQAVTAARQAAEERA